MPAPPEVEVTINQEALARVCAELNIPIPLVRVRPAKNDTMHGLWTSTCITIYAGLEFHAANRLLYVAREIAITLLHELRHAHQRLYWTPKKLEEDKRYSYNIKPSEIDAEDFATRALTRYRDLVRVRRRQASNLGRLSKAEASVRQRV